jgi:hypothetical protein
MDKCGVVKQLNKLFNLTIVIVIIMILISGLLLVVNITNINFKEFNYFYGLLIGLLGNGILIFILEKVNKKYECPNRLN